jgi:hypothetical protein
VSVEFERGAAVGVAFIGMHAPGAELEQAAKLPRLWRVTFASSTVTAAAIRQFNPVEQLSEVLIVQPAKPLDDEVLAALGELKSLRKLAFRGAAIGEDLEFALKQRFPHVEIVFGPPHDPNESASSTAKKPDEVQWVW